MSGYWQVICYMYDEKIPDEIEMVSRAFYEEFHADLWEEKCGYTCTEIRYYPAGKRKKN